MGMNGSKGRAKTLKAARKRLAARREIESDDDFHARVQRESAERRKLREQTQRQ